MNWFKKAAELRLGTALVVLIMFALLLAGCQATSDESTPSQLTGSWEGTLDSKAVRAIFAPDNYFHLAYLDDSGELTGEITSLIENVGQGTVTIRPSAGTTNDFTFQLTPTTLEGSVAGLPLALHSTSDANHSASQSDVKGQWILNPALSTSDVLVKPAGELVGSDDENCDYSGTLQLISSDWNIYQLDLTVAKKTVSSTCPISGGYAGYAMVIGETLWFSTAEVGGGKYLSGEWYATANVAPVAYVKPFPAPVTVVAGETPVELDGSGSSDANHDPLEYTWSKVPLNSPAALTKEKSAVASFTAPEGGNYTFKLTVSDGVAPPVSTNVTVTVATVTDRFNDSNNNGTVTDNTTGLVWLKDANCADYIGSGFGLNLSEAKVQIDLLKAGSCGLNDGSVAGVWRLPNRDELASLVDKRFSPTLSNRAGTAQWTPNDAFLQVGAGTFFSYWTDTADPQADFANFYIDFADGDQHTANIGTPFLVWPVRNP